MDIEFQDNENMSVVKMHGDFLGEDCDPFRTEVLSRLDKKIRDFILDVSEVEFVDSQGLESLVWLRDTCEENLGQMRLASPDQNLRDILRITRLEGRLPVHETVDDAAESMR